MPDINVFEIMFTSIKQNVIPIILPYFVPIIIVAITLAVVKIIFGRITYYFSIISGYSQRETKKRVTKIKDLIDLLSSILDIFKKTT